MSTLSSLLAYVITLLQSTEYVKRIISVYTDSFSENQFVLKVRAQLDKGFTFQVHIYYNRGHCDYSYQLFKEVPILRWDNKEHFPGLETFPHHFHSAEGDVKASPLRGEPKEDLPIVLSEIKSFIQIS